MLSAACLIFVALSALSVVAAPTSDSDIKAPVASTLNTTPSVIPDWFQGCKKSEKRALTTAYTSAQTIVDNASRYTDRLMNNSDSPRFEKWFGTLTADRLTKVRNTLDILTDGPFRTFGYICESRRNANCTAGQTAFVDPATYGIIHLCPSFFQRGTDQVGTIIRQSTLFDAVGDTRFIVTCVNCSENLASTAPDLAVQNADSYLYYVQNNPPLA